MDSSQLFRATRGMRVLARAVAVLGISLGTQAPSVVPVAQAQTFTPDPAELANTPVHDYWMADMASSIGRQRLGVVILPASHDSATYGFLSQKWDGPDPPGYTADQSMDIYTQLQHGIRVLDLRGRKFNWSGTDDYYVYHGKDTTNLSLASVLDDVARWVKAPGHEKEVVIVKVDMDFGSSGPTTRSDDICNGFKQKVGGLLLTPESFTEATAAANAQRQQQASQQAIQQVANPTNPRVDVPEVPIPSFSSLGNPDLAHYTLDDVWHLPGQQRVILKWDKCGYPWPEHTWNDYWANQCYAKDYTAIPTGVAVLKELTAGITTDPSTLSRPGIIEAVRIALDGRLRNNGSDGRFNGLGSIDTQATTFTKEFGRNVPVGFYGLGAHATITSECGLPIAAFVGIEQSGALDAMKSWFDTGQNHARDYLNIISADFVQRSKLMDYVLQMNTPPSD